MWKFIYEDIVKELNSIRLWFKLWKAFVVICLAIITADIRSWKYMLIERKKHGRKAFKMNFNVMIMAFYNKRSEVVEDRFMIASNNEVIVLARKLRWLPKRMTAPIMQHRNSVFYTTCPKMSKRKAIVKYINYVEAKFYTELPQKNKLQTT